ncbi:MAG: ATP-binding protein [Anaerolineales bacterium]
MIILQKLVKEKKEQERQIEIYRQFEEQTNEKIKEILMVSQQFAAAREEQQIVDLGLQLFVKLLNAKAAAFTPFDERGQTLPAKVLGELPEDISKDWLEYLSSPFVRSKCPNCQRIERLNFDCPLLLSSTRVTGVYCAPVRRAEQELGIFHFFLTPTENNFRVDRTKNEFLSSKDLHRKEEGFNQENEALIRLIADQTGLALETIRLKNREERIVSQLNIIHEQMDFGKIIQKLVESANQGINGEGTIAKIWGNNPIEKFQLYQSGKLEPIERKSLEDIIQQVVYTGEMVVVKDKTKDGSSTLNLGCSIGIPIKRNNLALWGVLAGYSNLFNGFTEDQIMMLKAIAAQITLILQNSDALAELEYKAILQERIRLAREIHDGLAQTLGFLKLRLSQLQMYYEKGEKDKIKQTIQQLYQIVANAYLETRTTIDQLRLSMENISLEALLQETLKEFIDSSGIEGLFHYDILDTRLPGEVNAQLIRIVQEALSNVRKHSHATKVDLVCYSQENEMIIEVRDNGIGFEPQEIHSRSEYGLKGMKERAEIIGADIHIVSHVGKGATVQIKLPVTYLEGKMVK